MKLYLMAGLLALLFAERTCSELQGKGKSMETVSSRQELEQSIGKTVSLHGTALDAKAGAVVKVAGGLVYIRDLSAWPPELSGKHVIAEGKLTRKKIMPDPIKSESGLTPQGAFGEHFLLENARWKRAE